MTDPSDLAAADQELAGIEQRLGELIALWRARQGSYDLLGMDRLDRVAAFMRGDVMPWLDATGSAAALAVAVERLAAQ